MAAAPSETGEAGTAKAREHLANERTLFAWIRTAIALIGLGFVVARFGLFLRAITIEQGRMAGGDPVWAEVIGIVLVAAGGLASGLSVRRFRRARAQSEAGRFVPEILGDMCIVGVTLAVGLALIVYLLVSE